MTTDSTGGDYDEGLPLLGSFPLTSSLFVFVFLFLFFHAFLLGIIPVLEYGGIVGNLVVSADGSITTS